MKIVCMDCQTESHIEVELLKDKKRFECEHCAKNPPAISRNQTGEQSQFPPKDTVDFYSIPASAALSEDDLLQLGGDEILDIPLLPSLPDPSPSPQMDEITLNPIDDLNSARLEEDSNAVLIDDDPVKGENLAPETPQQLFSTDAPLDEVFTQTSEVSHLPQLAEETSPELLSTPKGIKGLTVKTSILMGVAAVFVLFIALGDKIIRPASSKPSPQTETSRPVIAPEQGTKPDAPVASGVQPEVATKAAQPEAAQPIPTPSAQVIETKPVAEPPATNHPPVAALEGQFTIQVGSHNNEGQANEQAGKLRSAGFEPRVVSVDIPKRGRWYRVQSGNFSNRVEANRYGSQILSKGAAETFVIASL